MAAPVESKVSAATLAAAVSAAVVTWLVTAVPGLSGLSDVLRVLIAAAITTGITFAAGWLTRHTPRP